MSPLSKPRNKINLVGNDARPVASFDFLNVGSVPDRIDNNQNGSQIQQEHDDTQLDTEPKQLISIPGIICEGVCFQDESELQGMFILK